MSVCPIGRIILEYMALKSQRRETKKYFERFLFFSFKPEARESRWILESGTAGRTFDMSDLSSRFDDPRTLVTHRRCVDNNDDNDIDENPDRCNGRTSCGRTRRAKCRNVESAISVLAPERDASLDRVAPLPRVGDGSKVTAHAIFVESTLDTVSSRRSHRRSRITNASIHSYWA